MAAVNSLDRWLHAIMVQAWSKLDPSQLQTSFVGTVMPIIIPSLIHAQTTAADIGAGYLARQAAALNVDPGPYVQPEAFAGVASDGRDLSGLIVQPLLSTYSDLSDGAEMDDALDDGMDSMDRILTTQVHDSARAAEQVGLVSTRGLSGYVRVLEGDACDRCIELAGRTYRYAADFLRHPNCRCTSAAVGDDDGSSTGVQPQDIKDIFDALTGAQQDKSFGIAGAQAINDGADISQVVNAKRGMQSAADVYGQQLQITTEGITQQGVAGQAMKAAGLNPRTSPRLMPGSIYQVAGDDRNLQIKLLHQYGYIL